MISLPTMRISRMIGYTFMPDEVAELIVRQAALIRELREVRAKEKLEYSRNLRELLLRFRHLLDDPDLDDAKEPLDEAIRDLSDEVARAEEHLC